MKSIYQESPTEHNKEKENNAKDCLCSIHIQTLIRGEELRNLPSPLA